MQVNPSPFAPTSADLPLPSEWEDFDSAPEPEAEQLPAAFVVGIVGDSGSGKNTVADAVAGLFGPERVADLRLDDYHRFTRDERAERGLTPLNPAVHDLSLVEEHLRLLRRGRPIQIRSYRHADGSFGPSRTVEPRPIVVARGLLGFPNPRLHRLYDLSVFLRPEPDLLFRWKLRRDVLFRGYSEAAVLKHIVQHLLDAKEFVLPQADVAHVLVDYVLPEWEAPDSEVQTRIRLRGGAAELARSDELASFPVQPVEDAGELVMEVPPDLPEESVDSWAVQRFGAAYSPAATGLYHDENGEARRRAPLALVEVLIASLGSAMAARGDGVPVD